MYTGIMSIRAADSAEIAQWDAKILANPDGGDSLQSEEFATQKKRTGWTPRYLVNDETGVAVTVHEKHVFSLGRMWYIPKGPGVKTLVQLGDMLPPLRELALKNDVFAIKVEPELMRTDETIHALKELGLVKVAPIQPYFSTILVDLSPSSDAIMASFDQKGRNAIRRAKREGATVKQVDPTDENCTIFYNLLSETASNSFTIRSYDYFRQFWQSYADAAIGQLFFTYYQDRVVAAAFAITFGQKSLYKDGASIRQKTVYGASHLLQWHVMQWAKEKGSVVHDLGGCPPSDRIKDPTHPWYGVGLFKLGFSKNVVDYIGAFDLSVKPRHYKRWAKYGEKLAKRVWWYRHHESWY